MVTRTVLVTGAGRRVGAAIARALAARGDFVIIHYARSAAAAQALAAEIGGAGGRCGTIDADLADRAQIGSLIARCEDAFGPLDVLVNNASGYRYDTAATLEPAAWDENLRTNLEAPMFLARAFHAARAGRPAAIVNMLDFKVTCLNPDYFSYTVAKIGLSGATRLLAMAFKGVVRANGVAPGLTMPSGKQTDEQFARAWAMTPLGYGPTPEELCRAVMFLIDTPSVNGQVLCLDGGAGLRPRARDISVDPAAL